MSACRIDTKREDVLGSFPVHPCRLLNAHRPSHRSRIARDMHLAGLLTHASSALNRLPRERSSSGLLIQASALTVAGQWRTFTALPKYQIRSYSRTKQELSINFFCSASLALWVICAKSRRSRHLAVPKKKKKAHARTQDTSVHQSEATRGKQPNVDQQQIIASAPDRLPTSFHLGRFAVMAS